MAVFGKKSARFSAATSIIDAMNTTSESRTITITDGDIVRRVIGEQARRGDGTAAKTAAKLMLERLAEIAQAALIEKQRSVNTDGTSAPVAASSTR